MLQQALESDPEESVVDATDGLDDESAYGSDNVQEEEDFVDSDGEDEAGNDQQVPTTTPNSAYSQPDTFPMFERWYRKTPDHYGPLVFGKLIEYRFSETLDKADINEGNDMRVTCAFFEIFLTGALDGYSFHIDRSSRWHGTCSHNAIHEGVRAVSKK